MTHKPYSRPNKVLDALTKGQTPFGMQMYTHDPDLVEIVGYCGFDFVMLDMEHNRTNPETMVHLIRAAEASGVSPLVRVGENDAYVIRSAVESGARGIIVPHIKNAVEARRAQFSMRYAPEGTCGICPAIRASGYSQENWEDYMAEANRLIMFVALLEDVDAINHAEEIIGELKPGRDALGLGLADISNSLLKTPGDRVQWQHPYLKEASDKVRTLCEKNNIPMMGMAWPKSDRAGVEAAKANGTKIIIFHPDTYFWYETCRNIMKDVKG